MSDDVSVTEESYETIENEDENESENNEENEVMPANKKTAGMKTTISGENGKKSYEITVEEEYNRRIDYLSSEYIYLLQLSYYSTFFGPQPKHIWRNDGKLMKLPYDSDNGITTLQFNSIKDMGYKEFEGWIAKQVLY
ncbi:hypothetical protein RFI_26487 [Reticulomyxa filosa]|uniref:Uncharacterized protein n=1 Tax=Reticulomyxa filosa TaxID=46433 RepID=X6MCZ6_RETFI|nr:hypothetical protein RFI_26487 [Reticulomyxa filosa]|eukprot:ETO10890.1 hypothetical protein RFI_26487 [Reticulomyxa filosa]